MISTHALREEGDDPSGVYGDTIVNFYPRPPRGGRPVAVGGNLVGALISTHALREEGDRADAQERGLLDISTHALREEGDAAVTSFIVSISISTHALREEGDAVHGRCLHHRRNFYPRPPRGGRLDTITILQFPV